MHKVHIITALSVFGIWLACTAFFAIRVMNYLSQQNESLIIRNDSLHILQIKTRIQLSHAEHKLDSLVRFGPRKQLINN